MHFYFKNFIIIFACLFIATQTNAQAHKIIQGIVVDKQSDEPLPFASVVFKKSKIGVLTDSVGHFYFNLDRWFPDDTLRIINVGHEDALIPLALLTDTGSIKVQMKVEPPKFEAVVRAKYNRAVWFWKKIMANKKLHDKTHWNNYAYEIYNKLELDLINLNVDKLSKNRILKPLDFVFNYIDSTSEDKPFLPAYLIETLSNYYHQKNPSRSKEIIKATKTNGIENESIIKQLGGMYQNVDVYANFIPVFDKQFVSPFNENATNYYNFKLLDTQYLYNRRLVHLRFTPKHKGSDVFEGDCWVADTSYALQKITLRPSVDANINYISGLSLIQEFKPLNDSSWFLYKDKFVADISPIGAKNISFKGRKTATYKNVSVNQDSIATVLSENKKAEDVVIAPGGMDEKADSFWLLHRHEELSKSEKTVYLLLDTLEKNKTYIRYRNAIQVLSTGVKDVGNYRIGPWYYWLSGNSWEGVRTRFDISTNKDFDKHWYFSTYLAYGFGDKSFKGKAQARYEFARTPWSYIDLSYKNDLDNGQIYYDQLGTDNVFGTAFRRPNIPYKFLRSEQTRFEVYKENNKGFGFGFTATSKQFQPLLNLPGKEYFPSNNGNTPLNTFETEFHLRFAYLERIIAENFDRTSFGSDYPIIDLKYAHGFPGVLKSNYKYDKITLTVSDYLKIPPYGSIYYNVFAGKIFGTLPYPLLEIHPGNELYYYNRYAYNLMNRYEYISDQYAGFNIEHVIGRGLFKYFAPTRKWKLRQFWEAKGLIGNLSDANKTLNYVANYPFKSLNGKWYCEVGTGVDNIFKYFRVDVVWRVTPPTSTQPVNRFGVFGSFRIAF